jgi:hypothetical protein
MSASTKLVDKLEGVENYRAWKYRIGLILEENDLARFVKEEVSEPDNATDKEKHQKDTIRAKRIIARFNQRSHDSLCVIKEESKRNV